MLVYALLLVLSLVILHICIRYRRAGRFIHHIPGPPGLPILGNILSFNISSKQAWELTHELLTKYPLFKAWCGFKTVVLTRDPDYVKVLMSCKRNINKEIAGYNNFQYMGNSGIVISGGKLWETRRKLLNPAFSLKILEIYSETLEKQSRKFTNQLLSHDKVAVHDVSKIFMKFAFGIICEATMYFDMDTADEKEGDDFRNAFIEFGELCYYRVLRPYIKNWMIPFLPLGRRQDKLWKILNGFAGKVIDERRKYHAQMGQKAFNDYLDNVKKGIRDDETEKARKNLSILDLLLLNEEKGLIDSKGVLDETIMMIAAGFETAGVAMMFLIILLAENKEAQELAREELLDVMGGYGHEITMDHVKKLDYLERCAKESMRLFSVAPFIGRSIDEDVQLGDYTVPAGTDVYVSIFELHRDPDLWPDPLKFDPDRFLPEKVQRQHRYAFVPFSKGPRGCIGKKFAMNEMKIAIAHVLYNFHLDAIDRSADFKFYLGVTLQLDRALVRFTKIDKTS